MEILSQTDIYITPTWAVVTFVIGMIFIGIGFAAFIDGATDYSDNEMFFGLIIGALGIVLAITGIIVDSFFQIDSGRDQYEIIINESVDTEEFLQKYEIIKQRDRIWVIEDREVEEND